ncbi:MAG: carbohydrate kinase family protein [Anaerolineae bacterium]|nr:carbohydrate kinase family protein [Anaerolineae bacterium]
MSDCDAFCYGPVAVDNIIRMPNLPAPDRPAWATADEYHTGGGMANTAAWLAHFGTRVRFSGRTLGYDEYGDLVIERFKRIPTLDLTYLERRADVRTPICRVMVTPDGQRTFLNFWFHLSPETPLTTEMLDGARFLLGDRHASDKPLEAAEIAHAHGVPDILVSDIVTLAHPTLPLTTIIHNSADLIRGRLPGVDVRKHVHALREVNRGIAILTDSAKPVYVIRRDGSTFTVTPPKVEVVDATGAGDALRAGLAYGLLQGWSLENAVCFGVAAGSLKVRHVGATSHLATREETEALARTLRAEPT